MSYIISNHGGSAPPYGPQPIVLDDDMFLTDEDAAAFAAGFAALIDAHTPSVDPNYVMVKDESVATQIYPSP